MKKVSVLFLFCSIMFIPFTPAVFGKGTSSSINGPFKMPKGITAADYQNHVVIFKLKQEHRHSAGPNEISIESINTVLVSLDFNLLGKMFPFSPAPKEEKNSLGQKYADLSLIYQFHYNASVSLEDAINRVIATGAVEYAQPKYIQRPFITPVTPNDAFFANSGQYFIKKIKADSAWGINTTTARGDTNVVIGIVDTGTDWDHPDLVANVKINYGEIQGNGIDDDGDGYIDNYHGWDMSDNDNNPTVGTLSSSQYHGSHVSGCADAVTNNAVGVASPAGYFCKFLPIKASPDTSSSALLYTGYEGITYAADHGCSIINCSWGGTYASNMEQDVVTYASINKNALVVVSAGNNYTLEDDYPASLNYAFSVAATTSTDARASFSNYGYNVDVSAPGNNIYSTYYNNAYSQLSGTSMSSPITAGAAAVVKSYFPWYTGLQAGEKLRVTCDKIQTQNPGTYMYLGKGRINLYHALIQSSPSVRMINVTTTDNNDNVFLIGDTIRFHGDFINYLNSTSNLTVTLSSAASAVTIINSTINVGVLDSLPLFNTNSNPFSFKINSSAPLNTNVIFTLTFSDGTYTDTQFLQAIVNVDYINITVNDVSTTNTSKGKLCYNGQGQVQGLGFSYHDSSMVYESGLMVGIPGKVSDNMRGTGTTNDNDFTTVSLIKKDIPSLISVFDLSGSFSDAGAGVDTLNLLITHRSFAWDTVPYRKFVMFQYSIKNKGVNTDSLLYAGIFTDWDVTSATYKFNSASWDASTRMGYVWNPGSSLYGATKLLSHGGVHGYAIDNITGGAGGIDISGGYTSAQKYTTLSTDRADAGATSTGNDVCNVVSTGPFTLHHGDSVIVAFALIAGDNLAQLKDNAVEAQKLYDLLFPEDTTTHTGINTPQLEDPKLEFLSIAPNPSKGNTTFSFNVGEQGNVLLELYDITGQKVKTLTNQWLQPGIYSLSSDFTGLTAGIYYCRLSQGGQVSTKKMVITGVE